MKHVELLKPNDPLIDLEPDLGNAMWGDIANRILNVTLDVAFFSDDAFKFTNISKMQRFFDEHLSAPTQLR
jgi:hypothetical protein